MYRSMIVSLLALLSLSVPSWASVIYVSGDQTGTWSADTVIVTAEVRVPPGQSLTVSPGVEVLFQVYCKLIVDNRATLLAVGTPVDSIRLDVLPPDTAWHGIRFLSASDSSRLEYCLLTHGLATGSEEDQNGGAIYCSNSNPVISGNTIWGNSAFGTDDYIGGGGGIYCDDNSNPIICGNIIAGNYTSGEHAEGGGIYCYNSSSPIINSNTITGNHAGTHNASGGGICCEDNSNPLIINNFISANSSCYQGGGIFCVASSNPIISSNCIIGNSVEALYGYGGGISCYIGSSPIISGNTIAGNRIWGEIASGGGICATHYSNPIINDNRISRNSATDGGGIGAEWESNPTMSGNTISRNMARFGGGISCIYYSNAIISSNTISENLAVWGGGIRCYDSNPTLANCILWGNTPQQIYGDTAQVSYSDIQGGWFGTGNIATYPAFVDTAQSDYRLQWGSPCIDTGDPNPIYNDPDGTRADMGAWYYDQSMPVRILLTPYNAPIQVPASGGSFHYAIQVTNIGSTTLPILIWCNVTLPSGTIYGPVLGPLTISLVGQTLSRLRTQSIPARAPAGMYHYNAYAVAAGDTSEDSFTFTKLGSGIRDSGFGGWTNAGKAFDLADVGARHASPLQPAEFSVAIFPNPFNPMTVLSYQLPVASHVSLRIFDTAGRLVEELVNGWREAGEHQITFDGTGLPSGIYFAKLTVADPFGTGDYSQVQKMVLMK